MEWLKYTIILVILIIIAIAVIKSGKKDFKIEANKLVELLGGKLEIELKDGHIFMTGPATTVFEGVIKI